MTRVCKAMAQASPLGVASGGINNTHLANDAVTENKIADNAVTASELADGSVTSPKITAPLSLTSADANFTLSATNTGAGAAITANGAINTTTHYNISGQRILSNAVDARIDPKHRCEIPRITEAPFHSRYCLSLRSSQAHHDWHQQKAER